MNGKKFEVKKYIKRGAYKWELICTIDGINNKIKNLIFCKVIYLISEFKILKSCECENLMTAVERIQEYSTLPSEPLETGEIKPPSDWPTKGAIKFKNVSFSYAKKLPDVLHNLSFEIQPNEKIGIIGRTGAGLFK